MFLSRKSVADYIRKGYDLALQGRIQPDGLDFKENDYYIRTASGVFSIAYIGNGDYPKSDLAPFWASGMVQIDGVNVLRFISNNDKYSDEADKSISNLNHSSNRNFTDDINDSSEVSSLLETKAIADSNGRIKNVAVSYVVPADTEQQLKQRERELKGNLPGYSVHISQGMMQVEYDTTFIPPSIHPALPTGRKPQPISTVTLAAGFPFAHTSLTDKNGIFLGFTGTDGPILFDMLHRNNERRRSTLMIAGRNDSGKGKLLAKYLDGLFFKGHTLINIDLNGSLSELTREQAGLVIDIVDGESEYHINPLQIMATRISEDTLETDQVRSYKIHRNKLKVMASIKDPSLTQTDFNNLMETTDEMYADFGLWEMSEAKQKNSYLHLTDVTWEDYPLLSNLVDALDADWRRERSRGEAGKSKAESYEKLVSAFNAILNDYRYMNKHSRFVDIEGEQVVTFNLSKIDDKALLHIVLYQILSLASAEAVKHGIKNKIDAENTVSNKEQNQVIVTITGADKLFEPSYSQSLTFLAEMIEEISKDNTGIILEVSSLDKILSSAEADEFSPYVLATRSVFSQMLYRILTQQDAMIIPKIAKNFGDITQSELDGLRYLQNEQFFLNISGVSNYSFVMQLTDRTDADYYGLTYAEDDRYARMR